MSEAEMTWEPELRAICTPEDYFKFLPEGVEIKFDLLWKRLRQELPDFVIAIDGLGLAGKDTVCKELGDKQHLAQEVPPMNAGMFYRAVTWYVQEKWDGGVQAFISADDSEQRKLLESFELEFTQIDHDGEARGIQIIDREENQAGVEVLRNVLYSEKVDLEVAQVSPLEAVRDKVEAKEKELVREHGGPAQGRNMATEVFPNAELKVYLMAGVNVLGSRQAKRSKVERLMKYLEEAGVDSLIIDESSVEIKGEELIKGIDRCRDRNNADHDRERGRLWKPEQAIEGLKTGDYHLVIDSSDESMTPDQVVKIIGVELVERLGWDLEEFYINS